MLDTLGFYARSINDLEMIAEVFRLQDDEQETSQYDLKGAKFAFCKTEIWNQAGEGTIQAMQKAAEILKRRGAQVDDIELPSEFDDFPKYNHRVMYAEGRVSFLGDYYLAKGKLNPFIVGVVENEHKITKRQQLEAFDMIGSLRPKFDSIAEQYDAVITPSVPDEAPEGIESTGSAAFCAMWTVRIPTSFLTSFQY